ncbi:hypothetical protein XcuCFBP2542_14650 [Xanthomonas cucurbitae]|uniref:Uncharacterized protein n=1 Tax=Xanthomonas cucurbitae TaxID=56453 RepID=A0A2S7DNE9_9XANT|nr:hypothetical protein XcuCFBP2542_14650 [Xanthomonas cucurbitae]
MGNGEWGMGNGEWGMGNRRSDFPLSDGGRGLATFICSNASVSRSTDSPFPIPDSQPSSHIDRLDVHELMDAVIGQFAAEA